MFRLSKGVNGIYNTIEYNNGIWFVPRHYPFIVKVSEENNISCRVKYTLNYSLGTGGVILLQDRKYFYCVSRFEGNLIRVHKNSGKSACVKYTDIGNEYMSAYIYENCIFLFPKNLDDKIIIGSVEKWNFKKIKIDMNGSTYRSGLQNCQYVKRKNEVIGIVKNTSLIMVFDIKDRSHKIINLKSRGVKSILSIAVTGTLDLLLVLEERKLAIISDRLAEKFEIKKTIQVKESYRSVLCCKEYCMLISNSYVDIYLDTDFYLVKRIVLNEIVDSGTKYFSAMQRCYHLILLPWKATKIIDVNLKDLCVTKVDMEMVSSELPVLVQERNCGLTDFIYALMYDYENNECI